MQSTYIRSQSILCSKSSSQAAIFKKAFEGADDTASALLATAKIAYGENGWWHSHFDFVNCKKFMLVSHKELFY